MDSVFIFDLLETESFEKITKMIDKILINKKLENITNNEGLGLLHVAWQNGNLPLLKYLRSKQDWTIK